MLKFAPYVVKTLWRHRTRTALTVSGTAVALLVFCCVGSVQEAMQRLTSDRQLQRTLIVFQENRFCPATSKLPEDYARALIKQPGVEQVVPIKVLTNNCRASLDVVVFNGLPPDLLPSARELELVAGNWSDFQRQTDAALVGSAVADRRNLSPGDKFSIGEVTVSVVGIFRSATAAEESFIYTHLDFLQRARGRNDVGTVTQFEVHLADDADPEAVAAAIDSHFRDGPVATTTRSKGVFQADTLADLAELIGLAHWLGYACIGLVLSLVATTTVMSVQDRIGEHAILQTIGVRPGRIFRLVVAESVIMSLAGGLLGISLASAFLSFSGLAIGAEGVTVAFRPSLHLAVVGSLVSLAVGLLAGILPGIQAARSEIAPALKAL